MYKTHKIPSLYSWTCIQRTGNTVITTCNVGKVRKWWSSCLWVGNSCLWVGACEWESLGGSLWVGTSGWEPVSGSLWVGGRRVSTNINFLKPPWKTHPFLSYNHSRGLPLGGAIQFLFKRVDHYIQVTVIINEVFCYVKGNIRNFKDSFCL